MIINKACTADGEVDTKVLKERVEGIAYKAIKAIIAENGNSMNK